MNKKNAIYVWNEPCSKCGQSHKVDKTRYDLNATFKCIDCDIQEVKEELKRLKSLKKEKSQQGNL